MNDLVQTYTTGVVTKDDVSSFRHSIRNFQETLDEHPSIDMGSSRNGNDYVVISHVEMKLDEMFSGHWSTENFQYKQIVNEIVGSITLKVVHPITGMWITREGAAAVQIMQDKGSKIEDIIHTKKKNALETCFPKLKAMCLKNAAASIGRIFGRDLNRKQVAEFSKTSNNYKVISQEQIDNINKITDDKALNQLSKKFGGIEFIPADKYDVVIKWIEGEIS